MRAIAAKLDPVETLACLQAMTGADEGSVVPPPRFRAIVYTGAVKPGPHGTETQTAHEQATFPDAAVADRWLTDRVNATGKEGVLLIQREEALRVYRPLKAKS